MTQVAIGGLDLWPDIYPDPTLTTNSTILDSTADYVGCIFQAPKTGTIDYIHWRVSAVTGWTGTLQVRIVDVDMATGGPGTTTNGSTYTISTQAANTNYVTTALGASVTGGQWYAIRIECSAISAGSISIHRSASYQMSGAAAYCVPYIVNSTDNAGTLAKAAGVPLFGIEYSDGYTPMGVAPVCTLGTVSASNSGTTKVGNVFTSPFPLEAAGIWVIGDLDGDATFDVYQGSSTTPLATCTYDKDLRGTTGPGLHQLMFDSGGTLAIAAGTQYRVAITGTTATAGTIYRLLNVPENAQLDQFAGGKDWYYTAYAGSWSDTDTARAYIGLMVRKLSDGVGGGLLTHPGMSGGMRG